MTEQAAAVLSSVVASSMMLLQSIGLGGCIAAAEPPTPDVGAPCEFECTYVVQDVYPHDRGAFTQGLAYEGGILYEGTGIRGQSSLRRVDLESGAVEQRVDLDPRYFGEGIAIVDDRIIQLTWQANVGFVYDKETFVREREFEYPTEGWGLTYDGTQLIMSDGTNRLYFLDPNVFVETKRIEVSDPTGTVGQLNELEYIDGEIFANVWRTDYIVRIDPATGEVVGRIDLAGLLPTADRDFRTDVLNGIAYDEENDRLLVTGKRWPKLFHIDLVGVAEESEE